MDATSTPVGTGFFADNNGQELKNFASVICDKTYMKQRAQRVPHCQLPQAVNNERGGRSIKTKKRAYGGYRKPLILLVGMARFERAASASRTLRSSQAEPHPVEKGNISKTEHFGK